MQAMHRLRPPYDDSKLNQALSQFQQKVWLANKGSRWKQAT